MVSRPGLRLVRALLPGPRALPPARRDALRDVPPGRRGEGRPGVGRAADAVALGIQTAESDLQILVHRDPVPARRRRGRGGLADVPDPRAGREGRLPEGRARPRLERRRPDLGRRVLGSALVRLQPEAARPLPDRGQRLRDLGARRGQHAGRLDLEARCAASRASSSPRWTAATSSSPTTRCATRREYCRTRKGPALVHAHVIRPYSHSLSDDEALYRPKEERERELARDPVATMARLLVVRGDPLGGGARDS